MNLREIILDQVTEMEIYQHYLGGEVKLGRAMKSPLRQEKHPSFNVYQSQSNGKIYWKDFGDERGDCFTFVMRLHNCTFQEALHLVAQDFNLDIKEDKRDLSQIRRAAKKIRIPQIFSNPRKELPYARAPWSEKSFQLWYDGGVTITALTEYNTWPVLKVKVPKRDGDGHFVLHSKENDQIYCFDYENGIKKFYRPKAEKKAYKFISNLRSGDIFGLKQLKNHVSLTGKKVRVLIICAGQKDCLALYCNTYLRGIALNSESASITKEELIELMQYAENILVCYDNDPTGLKYAQKIKDEIGIDNIQLGDIVPADQVNDIFDYFKGKHPVDKFMELIENKL